MKHINSLLIMTQIHFSKSNNVKKPICERTGILEVISVEAVEIALEEILYRHFSSCLLHFSISLKVFVLFCFASTYPLKRQDIS